MTRWNTQHPGAEGALAWLQARCTLPWARWSRWSCVGFLLSGCFLRQPYPPAQAIVRDVDVHGLRGVARGPLERGLATAESPRFLGIWDGVGFEYEVYDPDVLRKDLERVERYLRARGYYEAKVIAARVTPIGERRVRIEIEVVQGAPVLTSSLRLEGLEMLPIEVGARVLQEIPLQVGERFDEDWFEQSKDRALRVLNNHGYALARVDGQATVDIAHHRADVRFRVEPGPTLVYGEIRINGLEAIPDSRVRANLGLTPGSAFSQNELEDARRALVNLGVFSHVQVRARRSQVRNNAIPIDVEVVEAELRTLRVGGGAQLDSLQLANHLSLGWEDRNFLGGLRRFSIDARPGLVYFPTRLGNWEAPNRALFRSRLGATLRQPSFFEGRTTGFVSADFNVFPLLYSRSEADDPVVGFTEVGTRAGLERNFWSHRLLLSGSLNWRFELPVRYSALSIGKRVDSSEDLLANLVIAFPELVAQLDLRDDPIETRSGAWFSVGLQHATGLLGSDVADWRVRPEARFFIPISRSVTFATRFTVGFLFPANYSQTLRTTPDASAASRRELAQDQQKLLFRGFFSGGSNSNRGYPPSGIGPHGEVLFLSPTADFCQDPTNQRQCTQPLGGLTLWESSAEVRFPIAGPLGAVLFVDASNVSRAQHLDFTAPHLSPGLGLRYGTPFGPIRFDAGYRLPFAQDFRREVPEGDPRLQDGLGIALHLSIGEAF